MRKSQYFRHQQRRSPKKLPLKKMLFGGLFFCLLVGLIYLAVWWPYLWIKEIEVKETKSVPVSEIKKIAQENLEKKVWWIVPRQSMVLVPINKIEKDILDRFPEIKIVNFYRRWPDSLLIKIEEREKVGIWCQIEYEEIETSTTSTEAIEEEILPRQKIKPEKKVNQCFYIDQEGIVFKESPLISGRLIVNIYSRKDSVKIRDKVVSPEIINFILAIKKGLPEIKTVSELLLEAVDFEIISLEDLKVTTDLGWQIYFNPTYSVDSQLNALALVLEQETKQAVDSLEYLDLRIEGRVYYK
jgi:hypothetical protein